ncbi:MAG TPA: hypothetical protein VF730_11990 [Terracidiphilus sp.]
MNSDHNIPGASASASNPSTDAVLKEMDATLRLMATLPVPAGLEDRVFSSVLAAPRSSHILEWPRPLYARDWVRSVAAAVMVLAIGGGGWGIYSRVQQNQRPSAITTQRTVPEAGRFSSAEMIRRPQTLNGPVVTKAEPAKAVKPEAVKAETLQGATPKKPAAHVIAHRHSAAKAVRTDAVSPIAK